ncbi:Ger(x)C family spore germination protein [Psychrobacillus lasiicapitis]|uniref:Ger(X)C family spore germination protein n=1 Tax=Psychrobacillus lasiicapitis TaxID=1636719 RepID=A0A544SX32_9BACI|nr:Ger(x)C family spore germination protein [Psychrobacillus lasiicapitis]TQR09755.1 Ger(x)C family spore germination protein [Psychrobacillus lasiicapitis]GGA23218.1 germination protein XA [Psychrobacillus lasiicapitis]
MNKKLILLILTIICLAGCADKELKVPLEDVGLLGILAFDYIDEDSYKLSAAMPQFLPEAKENTQIFSVTTDFVSKGIVEIETVSDKKVVLNQLRVVVFNEEFARNGDVQKVIRHLYRNAEVGNKVLVAIVKENGEEILKESYPDKPSINLYLNDLLQPSINTAFMPNTNIHDFVYTQTNPVFDTIVPLLEKQEGKIEIDGVALFKKDNMIEELLPREGLIIQALLGEKNLAPLNLTLDKGEEKEELMIDLIKNKVKMKSNKSIESPKLFINLKMEGTLIEYKGYREDELTTLASITKLEKDIDEQIEKDIEELLEDLKELKVDPVGLTENFRMYYKGNWDREMTEKIISKLEVDIKVTTRINSTGTLD